MSVLARLAARVERTRGASALMVPLLGQPAFGVESGHAAGAGGGDCLLVVTVGDIAGREHAGHAGVGPLRVLPQNVSLGIQLELPAQEIGVWDMADGQEPA